MTRPIIHGVVGVVGLVRFTGCVTLFPSSTPTPIPGAHQIATRSAGRISAIQSHRSLRPTGVLDYIDPLPIITLKELEGGLARSDDLRALVQLGSFRVARGR